MDPLLPSFGRELRARAHALDPVVAIGQHGLTPAVLREIDVALKAHELIKVRVFNGDREARRAMLGRIVGALDCAPVQQIGRLLVLWRPRPADGEPTVEKPAAARPRQRQRQRKSSPEAPRGVPRAALPRRRRGTG
jgi:putative YhbY family RNA-binding protein